jgi:hypothetical protein
MASGHPGVPTIPPLVVMWVTPVVRLVSGTVVQVFNFQAFDAGTDTNDSNSAAPAGSGEGSSLNLLQALRSNSMHGNLGLFRSTSTGGSGASNPNLIRGPRGSGGSSVGSASPLVGPASSPSGSNRQVSAGQSPQATAKSRGSRVRIAKEASGDTMRLPGTPSPAAAALSGAVTVPNPLRNAPPSASSHRADGGQPRQ